MKKFLLGLFFIVVPLCAQETQSATDLLNNFKTENEQVHQDQELGKILVSFLKTNTFKKAFVHLLKLKCSEEQLARFMELFTILIKIEQIASTPEFMEQYAILIKAFQAIQEEDVSEEQLATFEAEMRKKCPLVLEWQALSEELKVFITSSAEAFSTLKVEPILVNVIADLKEKA